jgi:hypothetical protein
VSETVVIVSDDDVQPEQFQALVEELGGESTGRDSAQLCREEACVWISIDPPGSLSQREQFMNECADLLGGRPTCLVTLEVSRRPEAEWIALEIVLAAAEKWHFILLDFGGEMLTLNELNTRVERRSYKFFAPDGSYVPSPIEARRSMADRITVVLPGAVDPHGFVLLMRSLGATANPDEETAAHLRRGGADVWLYTGSPGDVRIRAGMQTLGAPPYNAVTLAMSRKRESALLAVEVIEAAAARYDLLIKGPEGQLMTIDDLRIRVSVDASDLFSS